jgi:hypothetical protein
MTKKLGLRTIEYASDIEIVAWAHLEDGGIYSGRAVWGKDPFVGESTLGIIHEGAAPVGKTVNEAVGMAVLKVRKMLKLGVLQNS